MLRLSQRSFREWVFRVCMTSMSQRIQNWVMSTNEWGRLNFPIPTSSILIRGKWLNSLWAKLIEQDRLDEFSSESDFWPFRVLANELSDVESLPDAPVKHLGFIWRIYSMFFSMHWVDASMSFSSSAKLRMLRQLSTFKWLLKYWAHTWTILSNDKW